MTPSTTLLIHGGNSAIAGVLQPVHMRIAGSTIATITPATNSPQADGATAQLDATGCTLLPGMIDVHVHGAVGADTMDAEPVALGLAGGVGHGSRTVVGKILPMAAWICAISCRQQ